MEVKVDKGKFAQTKTKQQTAIENLRTHHNEQQAVFGELTSTWKGAGGDSFRGCAKEISSQTLMGIFTISSLDNQAQNAKEYFETVDKGVANAISG